MSDCLDDIVQLRDDDSDTLETAEEELSELDTDSECRPKERVEDVRWKMPSLTNTQLELQRINVRLARELQTTEVQQTLRTDNSLTRDCSRSWQGKVPPGLELLKHQLIEEFEMVCHKEKLTLFLLCGEIRKCIKNL